MKDLYIYNSLSRKKEIFKPINPKEISLYTCGPTVYGPGHLGHARSYTAFDVLKRVLMFNGYKVKHVLNITDVHDDMIKKAGELGISIFALAEKFIPLFHQDLKDLNILPASFYPRVTEFIPQIIEMTQALIDKGYAYVESDGSVYYRVSQFKNYGQLSHIKLDKSLTGTRVETDKYEKEDVSDFALWKAQKPGEPFWESPWARGRPGWHIECSVMSKHLLGKTLDLHAGAIDLKFPHHENEIAQSEAANNVKFVNYWVHAGLLDVNGQKMSKSLGNYIEIHKIKEKGFDPLALRYLFFGTHYRAKLNFTWESLKSAKNAFEKLKSFMEIDSSYDSDISGNKFVQLQDFKGQFTKSINDDLNMPKALSVVWRLIKAGYNNQSLVPSAQKLILEFDKVLGLKLTEAKKAKKEIPAKIKKLADERWQYRQQGDFEKADKLRKKIEELGFKIEDKKQTYQIQEN